MKPAYRRSRLWIDPPFQARLLVRMVVYLAIYVFVVWHFGFVLEAIRAVISKAEGKSLGTLYVDYFWQQVPLLYTFLLLLPALLYNLLKFSHRIAGPLFRCRKVMEEMAAGQQVREFTPRKHDLMGELFAAFNELIRTNNARVAAESNGHAAHVNGEAKNGVAAGPVTQGEVPAGHE